MGARPAIRAERSLKLRVEETVGSISQQLAQMVVHVQQADELETRVARVEERLP